MVGEGALVVGGGVGGGGGAGEGEGERGVVVVEAGHGRGRRRVGGARRHRHHRRASDPCSASFLALAGLLGCLAASIVWFGWPVLSLRPRGGHSQSRTEDGRGGGGEERNDAVARSRLEARGCGVAALEVVTGARACGVAAPMPPAAYKDARGRRGPRPPRAAFGVELWMPARVGETDAFGGSTFLFWGFEFLRPLLVLATWQVPAAVTTGACRARSQPQHSGPV